jgi:hypothetical protein
MFNNQDTHTLLQFTAQSKFTDHLKQFIFDIRNNCGYLKIFLTYATKFKYNK